MHILAVDDDPIILEIIAEVVRAMGDHTITTAESAAEAIRILGADDSTVDCFLLDIQMPETDGIELCRALRASGDFTHTPILMLTAMSDKAHIDAAFAAGANDYVVKPFEVFELQRRIRQAERRADLAEEQIDAEQSTADLTRKPGLLEQVRIFDVDNVIDYFALENYVPLLSRRDMFGSVVLGFHIRQIAEIHGMSDALQFNGLIEDVAETISDHLRPYQFLMSYVGGGTFLCVIEEADIPSQGALVDQINIAIARLELPVPTPRNLPVRLCCGEYVRLLGYRADAVDGALVQARLSAEQTASQLEREFDEIWMQERVAL